METEVDNMVQNAIEWEGQNQVALEVGRQGKILGMAIVEVACIDLAGKRSEYKNFVLCNHARPLFWAHSIAGSTAQDSVGMYSHDLPID